MKTIEERAHYAAWQIKEEIGLSEHSIERVTEIIEGKLIEQKDIDIEKAMFAFESACGWLSRFTWYARVLNEFIAKMKE